MGLLNNRYLILSELGKGGFGQTFLAEDTHLPSHRRCVIKQFKPANNDPNLLPHLQERFGLEASILERVGEEHSQIPRLYAYFVEDGQFYLVQELIDGQTLSQMVKTEGLLKSGVVREITSSLLELLDYLQAKDIIHRDIKPDNIIYRKHDGKPVLIDFGTVKETVTTVLGQERVPSSLIIGTPGYMPVEQAAGLAVYSSDLYSLGWTVIYLLTGKHPPELVDRRTGENLWRRFAPDVDYNLATVIDKAVQKVSHDRYATAGEMLEALHPVLPETIPSPLPEPIPPEPVIPKPPAAGRAPANMTNRPEMEFVWIPPGSFMMGSEVGNLKDKFMGDQKPVHQVTIGEGFYMGKYAVTQAQWQQVMGDNPSHFKGEELPVEQVSWTQASAFIARLNEQNDGYLYRLPSEAEWEYACRAGTTGEYAGDLEALAWYSKNSDNKTHPVGGKLPNAFGLFDMHGNVWEWCQDWYRNSYSYAGLPTDGSAWLKWNGPDKPKFRVVRGGSFNYKANFCRSAYRLRYDPDWRISTYVGLRVIAVALTPSSAS